MELVFNKLLKATVITNNEEMLDAYLESGLPVFGSFVNLLAEFASNPTALNLLKKLYQRVPLALIDFSSLKADAKKPEEISETLRLACEFYHCLDSTLR